MNFKLVFLFSEKLTKLDESVFLRTVTIVAIFIKMKPNGAHTLCYIIYNWAGVGAGL